MSLSLPALLGRILKNTRRIEDLPTIEDETQELVQGSLNDLKTLHAHIIDLSMFSPNDTLNDITTQDLLYLVLPYVFAQAQGKLKTTKRVDRMNSLVQAEKYLQNYIGVLEKYEVVPADERALFDRKTATVADFAKRRELKINQYKKEKDLKTRIETIRKRRRQRPTSEDASTDIDLALSLLPSDTPKTSENHEELDPDTDEALRETTLLLLRLFYAQASTQLQAMEQELELLRNAPPSPELGLPDDDKRETKRNHEDDEWRLDIPVPGGPDGKGPLMDSAGKPLRPFTILPSDAGERARLQAQIFSPGYNLPTMSVDEYLQIERQRGNVITSGGPASQAVPTSSEQLAIDAEMDGTVEGAIKAEEKRQKDEKWARYTDENPRGAGNTMNRG
ncbi:serine/threonine protein phosphatase PP2A-associated protein [Gymnopilus junonius]|uniref:Serine/threonine protein phosphatase PP2A-associated protein n=1 Tax=Gymnopilus junonius TaxID=109634 RepID=A0A9P5P1W4_GYMJU|nr:serine/threonine protein phosphatase PP2A-associated protein [Gymnopilus junonius]